MWKKIFSILLLSFAFGCATEPARAPQSSAPNPPAAQSTAIVPPAAPINAPTATSAPLKILKVNPEKGPIGTNFAVSGEGFDPGKTLDLQWATLEGSYSMKPTAETVEYYDREYKDKRVTLGRVQADAQGKIAANFIAPEDYGEPHDIYAVLDGKEIAKGGFRILRAVTFTPTEGPVGTLIKIQVMGIAWKPFESTLALRYDNKYMGFISAVTTRGTATFQIRAAGPVGQHLVQLIQSSSAQPYLNVEQSPVTYLWQGVATFDYRAIFNVTKDNGAPIASLDFPKLMNNIALDATIQRTGVTNLAAAANTNASIEPASSPILAPVTLKANGLPANSELELLWVTARGNRVSPSGWNLVQTSLVKATTTKDGALTALFKVPDDLGGWHSIKIAQGEKVLSEVPYYVERSFVAVTPQKVKAGEKFTIQVKGIGWTELDNGFAVTYDNGYIGYACGFNSNGDVTLNLVATGGVGTHLIDIYPMIFQGHGKSPWTYQIPQLTALQDHPSLALGYKLPIFRLAIEIVD